MAEMNVKRMDVVLILIFGNFQEPEKWAHNYPWKANINCEFQAIEKFKPKGLKFKAKVSGEKNIWMFEAMGGKNAKGHFYDMEFTSGELNGHPWTSFKPLAELFKDGTSRRILAPDSGEAEIAEKETPIPAVPPPKSPTAKPAASPPEPEPILDLNSQKARAFFDGISTPQSDPWWTFKRHLDLDGALACQVLDFSKHMAVMECAGIKGETDFVRDAANRSLDYWIVSLHERLKAMRYENVRERLTRYLGLTLTVNDVNEIMYKAWADLPYSLFAQVRALAVERLDQIKSGGAKSIGTLQPEVLKLTELVDTQHLQQLAGQTAKSLADPDSDEIKKVSETILKFTDWGKLLHYWLTCRAELQDSEELRDTMRFWMLNKFKSAQYETDVDGIRVKAPNWLLTPALEKELNEIYEKLCQF